MPYGVEARQIIDSPTLAQSIELGFGSGRNRPPAITRADQRRRDRFDDRDSLPTPHKDTARGAANIGKSWTSPEVVEIGTKLGSFATDRLHRATPEELTNQPVELV